MRGLLDINFLIALFDPKHVFHTKAHNWWAQNAGFGWASTTITEIGVIRIMSNPGYDRSTQFSVNTIANQFRKFTEQSDHKFWPDDVSVLDAKNIDLGKVLGPRQLTDLYLLALASQKKGRLVTMDRRISTLAVPVAVEKNLIVL